MNSPYEHLHNLPAAFNQEFIEATTLYQRQSDEYAAHVMGSTAYELALAQHMAQATLASHDQEASDLQLPSRVPMEEADRLLALRWEFGRKVAAILKSSGVVDPYAFQAAADNTHFHELSLTDTVRGLGGTTLIASLEKARSHTNRVTLLKVVFSPSQPAAQRHLRLTPTNPDKVVITDTTRLIGDPNLYDDLGKITFLDSIQRRPRP